MNEDWRWVPGYGDKYQVSNLGRIRSFARKGEPRLMKPYVSTRGYVQAILTDGGKSYSIWLHRLVASAFIPNPESRPSVNHKNGIKSDNTAGNLEWATYAENMTHSWRVLGSYDSRRASNQHMQAHAA